MNVCLYMYVWMPTDVQIPFAFYLLTTDCGFTSLGTCRNMPISAYHASSDYTH